MKPFLKRILTSTTYQQSSIRTDVRAQQVDPDNTLLWKQRVRRLESEAIRDAILTASGRLDRSQGGPPIPVEPRPDGSFVVKTLGLPTPASQYRRTVYLLARRNYHPTLPSVFDQPNMATNCSERSTSAVVLQSLTMLNDTFVLDQSAALAERVLTTAARDRWISTAFEVTLSRPPSDRESEFCQAALKREVEFHRQADPQCTNDEAENRAFTRICHTLSAGSESAASHTCAGCLASRSTAFAGPTESRTLGQIPPGIGSRSEDHHNRLTYSHHGSDETLTDARVTDARVVREILN